MSPQTGGSKPGKDFESVELGVLEGSEGEQQPQREKVPRRIIHFSSGETMEEYSTDEEEDQEPEKKDLLSSPVDAVRKSVNTEVVVMSSYNRSSVVAVQADLGSLLLVSHVESCHLHNLRFSLSKLRL